MERRTGAPSLKLMWDWQAAAEKKLEIDLQRPRPRGERVDDTHSDLVVDPQQQLAAPDGVVRVQR